MLLSERSLKSQRGVDAGEHMGPQAGLSLSGSQGNDGLVGWGMAPELTVSPTELRTVRGQGRPASPRLSSGSSLLSG